MVEIMEKTTIKTVKTNKLTKILKTFKYKTKSS